MTEVKPGDAIIISKVYGYDLIRVNKICRHMYQIEVLVGRDNLLMKTSIRKTIHVVENLGPLSPEQFKAASISAARGRADTHEIIRIFRAAFNRIVVQNIVSAASGDA